MPTPLTSVPDAQTPDPAGWDAVAAQLRAERARVFAELRAYPAPIAGCDVQFNQLLEQRDAIAAELAAWETLRRESPAGGIDSEAVRAFARASVFLDETVRGALLSHG